MQIKLIAFTIVVASSVYCGSGTVAQIIETKPLEPEPIRISIDALPKPFATDSAKNHPQVVPVPDAPVLNVPSGFRVNVYAELPNARWLAQTPEGDVLCVASRDDKVVLLTDDNDDGVAESQQTFVDKSNGAKLPFGMAFADGAFFLGNTDAVLRYAYDGDARRVSNPQPITELPGQGYNEHWTRNVVASPDGTKLYVSVGSKTNVDAEEPPRASVLRMNLDGSEREVFAFGLRNPVGLDFEPKSGNLYATVNERDGLGDNLVPDYLTHVEQGEFYGWPYAYFKPENLDPRRTADGKSERPGLVAKTHRPDLLFQSHSAALGLAFYDKNEFPSKYRGGAFVAFRGSWNRDRGTGYKIVFVPFGDDGKPADYYEDFVTGFLLKPEVPTTWGRPVGALVTDEGDLLFTEEANGRIYRVHYAGEEQ